MKRFLSLLLAVVMAVGILTVAPVQLPVSAAGADGLKFSYYKATDSYYVSGCADTVSGEVVIPSMYNNKPVTFIGAYVFEDKNNITSVVIPDTVTSISGSAFRNNTGITSVTIPDSVKTMAYEAFYCCTNLKTVNIPKNIKVLESRVFSGCSSLESIEIPDGVTEIKDDAFTYCSGLKKLVIPESVKKIGRAFDGCTGLEEITLPDSLEHLDGGNFWNSEYAKNEENWDEFGLYAGTILLQSRPSFEAPDAEAIIIREGTTLIATGSFYGYNKAKTITFPESLQHIGNESFNNCSSLTELNFPSKLKSIGEYSFQDCDALESVTIPGSVKTLERYIFWFCDNLKSVTILEGTKSIVSGAFDSCENLYEVSFPDSLTDIRGSLFGYSKVYENEKYWDGDVFYIGNHLIFGKNTLSGIYAMRDGTVSIAYGAFANADNLVGLIMPKSVKVINDMAFSVVENFYMIIYEGSRADFDNIQILGNSKDKLKNIKLICAADAKDPPAKVTVKSVSNVAGGVQISWNSVPGADLYLVYRRGSGTNEWVCLGLTDVTAVIDTSAEHNKYWRYSVQALNGAGLSEFDYNGKYLRYVETPALTGISNATNGIYFKWNKVAGASGYRVYRRAAGAKYWTYLGTVKGNGYTDTSVKNANGKYYRYTVRAVVNGLYSGYEDFLYTKRLVNPKMVSAKNTSQGYIEVKWKPVKSTTGYYVYRKTANSNWQYVGQTAGTNGTTFGDFYAKKGETYTYTVRAVYGNSVSYFDKGVSCKKK